jgi:hypothetical protein
MWKRTVLKDRLRLEPRWVNPPSTREETAFAEAAGRYVDFADPGAPGRPT